MKIISKKNIKRFVLVFALVMMLSAALILYARVTDRYRFSTEKWNEYEWNDRQLLIKDFLKQYDLREMTRAEIVLLLGDEPDIYEGYAVPYRTDNRLVYDFGQKQHTGPFAAAGNITLVITFDNHDRVIDYRLITYSW